MHWYYNNKDELEKPLEKTVKHLIYCDNKDERKKNCNNKRQNSFLKLSQRTPPQQRFGNGHTLLYQLMSVCFADEDGALRQNVSS